MFGVGFDVVVADGFLLCFCVYLSGRGRVVVDVGGIAVINVGKFGKDNGSAITSVVDCVLRSNVVGTDCSA